MNDSQYKSPFSVMRTEYYFDTDIRPRQILDEAEMQKRIVLRAAKLRPSSRSGLLWGFAINAALWGLFGCVVWWIGQLGFWDWIRGWF